MTPRGLNWMAENQALQPLLPQCDLPAYLFDLTQSRQHPYHRFFPLGASAALDHVIANTQPLISLAYPEEAPAARLVLRLCIDDKPGWAGTSQFADTLYSRSQSRWPHFQRTGRWTMMEPSVAGYIGSSLQGLSNTPFPSQAMSSPSSLAILADLCHPRTSS